MLIARDDIGLKCAVRHLLDDEFRLLFYLQTLSLRYLFVLRDNHTYTLAPIKTEQ